MIIAKYIFNSETDTLPTFNSGFTYTSSDVNNGDGTITRTIESDSSPTSITFTDCRQLLEVIELDTSGVTNMSRMFRRCINLTKLNTKFDSNKDI